MWGPARGQAMPCQGFPVSWRKLLFLSFGPQPELGCPSSLTPRKGAALSLEACFLLQLEIPGALSRPAGSLEGQTCVCLSCSLCPDPVKSTSSLWLAVELEPLSPRQSSGTHH